MSFVEALIRALFTICAVVLCYYLCIWVLDVLHIGLPGEVLVILKLMLALFAILILVRLFYPFISGFAFFPPKNPPA